MRVSVNQSKCSGFASCMLVAPDVFDIDEAENVAIVLEPSPPESRRAKVEEAVRSCPMRAITLVEDE
jgi:ferredoxin